MKESLSEKDTKAMLFAAGAMAAMSLILGGSLMCVLIFKTDINPPLGSFFYNNYWIFAFLIPILLGFSSYILANPDWRPGIFFLLASIPPILTLMLGYFCFNNFENFTERSSFLMSIGKNGLITTVGGLVIFEILIEILITVVIKNINFSKSRWNSSDLSERKQLGSPQDLEHLKVPDAWLSNRRASRSMKQ